MIDDIQRILYSKQVLQEKVSELGVKISADYYGKKLLLVSILKGSAVFLADLMRSITIPLEIDFMYVSSYENDTKSSGSVKIVKDLDVDVAEYNILIVEDILDSGVTLSYIIKMLSQRNPASIKVCTLFSKPMRRQASVDAEYCGFVIPDEFVVGYGLDYAQRYRNLPFLGILKREIYEKND